MFWKKFVELCAKKNKAPNAVIAEIGCASSAAVTGWSKGSIPRDRIIMAIAEYFDVPFDYFKSNEKEKSPANQLVIDEARAIAITKLCQLNPEEFARVDALIQQILAEREA